MKKKKELKGVNVIEYPSVEQVKNWLHQLKENDMIMNYEIESVGKVCKFKIQPNFPALPIWHVNLLIQEEL